MNKLRAGIIGCGNIGSKVDRSPGKKPVYSHAGAYRSHPAFELVAGADSDHSNLAAFSRKWGIKKVYVDYRAMIDNEALDIVSVCTPKELHYEAVKYAAQKGVRTIFCEKPFTGYTAKAKELVSLCAKKKLLLAVNFSRRYASAFRQIKRLAAEGALGKIQKVTCVYTKGVINNGSHLIDILIYIFGGVRFAERLTPLKKSALVKHDFDIDFRLVFKKGFSAYAFCCDARRYSLFEIDIIGEYGRIKVTESGFNVVFQKTVKSKAFTGYRVLEHKARVIESGLANALTNALANIAAVLKKKEKPLCSGSDALAVITVINKLIK